MAGLWRSQDYRHGHIHPAARTNRQAQHPKLDCEQLTLHSSPRPTLLSRGVTYLSPLSLITCTADGPHLTDCYGNVRGSGGLVPTALPHFAL